MSSYRESNLEEQLKVAGSLKITHPCEYSRPTPSKPSPNYRSSKNIKRSLKELPRICLSCEQSESKDLPPFKICGNCHAKHYCSRECQKKDWPQHKLVCSNIRRNKRLEKLVAAFMANAQLLAFLKFALVLELGLLDTPITELFSVFVHLAVEPADILDFSRLRGNIGPAGGAAPGGAIKLAA